MDTQLGARHRRSSEMGSIRPDEESTASAGNSGIGPSSSNKELWLSSVSGLLMPNLFSSIDAFVSKNNPRRSTIPLDCSDPVSLSQLRDECLHATQTRGIC